MVLAIVVFMPSFSLAMHDPMMRILSLSLSLLLTMLSLRLQQSVFVTVGWHGCLSSSLSPAQWTFLPHTRKHLRKHLTIDPKGDTFNKKKWLSLLQLTIRGEVCVCVFDGFSFIAYLLVSKALHREERTNRLSGEKREIFTDGQRCRDPCRRPWHAQPWSSRPHGPRHEDRRPSCWAC